MAMFYHCGKHYRQSSKSGSIRATGFCYNINMNKDNNSSTQEEKKNLKVEVLEKVSTLATAGFGLVAALAWNDAIKAIFTQLFPQPSDNLTALIGYAVVITVIVVIITIHLGRLVNLAKSKLNR